MSPNPPRPPRPPRPGGARPSGIGSTPSASAGRTRPPVPGGAQPNGLAGGSAKPSSEFGDTRTVILSRKSMSMHQTRKGAPGAPAAAPSAPGAPNRAPAPAAPPVQLPKASVLAGRVSCVACSQSFPIMGEQFYGAVVECPDCAAEFIIPQKAELPPTAFPPAPVAPVAPAPVAVTPAPVAPAPAAAPVAPVAPAPVAAIPAPAPAAAPAKSKKPSKPKSKAKRPKNVPEIIKSELGKDEEVLFCKSEAGSTSGSPILPVVLVLLTTIAGAATPFLKFKESTEILNWVLPLAVGLLCAIITFFVAMSKRKKANGESVLAVTNIRAIAIAGDFKAETPTDIE